MKRKHVSGHLLAMDGVPTQAVLQAYGAQVESEFINQQRALLAYFEVRGSVYPSYARNAARTHELLQALGVEA